MGVTQSLAAGVGTCPTCTGTPSCLHPHHDSIVTALIGAALGLPLGVLLAALTTGALGSLGIGFHLPGQELTAFVLLAVVAGIGAAVLPARRAARLNVLRALQYELTTCSIQ